MSYLFKRRDGKWAMARCPKCHKEIYALNVLDGICDRCGYDANSMSEKEVDNEKRSNDTKGTGDSTKQEQSG